MAVHQSESAKDEPMADSAIDPMFARSNECGLVATTAMPPVAMRADTALQLVRDELLLDGLSRLNLATFVTTWMEPEAKALMADTFDKNMIDKDEYPRTAELERRCVNMISRLWNTDEQGGATGTSTTGSSEASMLGGMALKWRWRQRMQKAGKPTDKPNMVMGANVQVCWEKFCRYWEVEPRMVPLEGNRFHLTGDQVAQYCDENTIGVVAILGSTFDGSYEPVKEICAALDQFQADKGIDVPVHVDGASGGFIAPFLDPQLEWDFRLPRVQSINASGHKYGLVYPGVGWVVWRSAEALPEDLVFRVNYLGGDMPTFALNFSRPGNQVVTQYYNFIRLGFEGYRAIQQACRDVAMRLAEKVGEMGPFWILTDGSELPVFAFALNEDVTGYDVFHVSKEMRSKGWLVPAYSFPENRQDLSVLRVVVRNGFSHDLGELFLSDLADAVKYLSSLSAPLPPEPEGYHH